MTKSLRNTLATLGIAVAVGATAVPMLSVWTQTEAPFAQGVDGSYFGYDELHQSKLIVDFKDGLSEADIQAIGREYDLKLVPNSIEAKDNRLYRATLSLKQIASADFIKRLKADSRVQAAEPEIEPVLSERTLLRDWGSGNDQHRNEAQHPDRADHSRAASRE